MLRPGFGAGDFLASVILVIGLTIVLLITESRLLAGFSSLYEEWRFRQAASDLAQKNEPERAAQWRALCRRTSPRCQGS